MIKFELPYNFNYDGKYFEYLEKYKDNFNRIKYIYLPIYNKDKERYNTREDFLYSHNFPSSIEEYDKHIFKIKEYGIDICFLIQRNASLDLIENCIKKYSVYNFTINDDALAKELKNIYSNKIHLNLSITRKLTKEEINTLDLSMYDNIVLYFSYNRDLECIKNLPTKYKYTIICNCECLHDCKMNDEHWFGNNNVSSYCISKRYLNKELNMKKSAYILCEDLKFFSKYINTFKLQGRDNSSEKIFNDFDSYINKKTKIKYFNYTEKDRISNYIKKTSN